MWLRDASNRRLRSCRTRKKSSIYRLCTPETLGTGWPTFATARAQMGTFSTGLFLLEGTSRFFCGVASDWAVACWWPTPCGIGPPATSFTAFHVFFSGPLPWPGNVQGTVFFCPPMRSRHRFYRRRSIAFFSFSCSSCYASQDFWAAALVSYISHSQPFSKSKT